MLRLALHNPAHQSYIHSFVFVHLWCFSLLPAPEFQVFGCKVQAWRDILYSNRHRGWRRPASPHDVVPFITHVLSIMRPPLLEVSWESCAVTDEAAVITLTRRSLVAPLALPLQPGHSSVQDCIDSWHAQAHPHALAKAADYLLLHVARYAGNTVHNSHSLALLAIVTLPLFGKSLRSFRASYRIVGVILHSGSRPGEGQHTAILRTGADCDRGRCWVVQDGQPATHQGTTPVHASQQCYVLALIKPPPQ